MAMRNGLTRLWFCLHIALAFVSACSNDEGASTQIVVWIDADASLRSKLTRVEVETYDPASSDASGMPMLVGKQPFPIGVQGAGKAVSFPFSFGILKNQAERFLLVVAGFEGEQLVIEQKALVGFVNGGSRMLSITLTDACYRTLCGEQGTRTWLQSSCDHEQGACAPVSTQETTIVVMGEDAGSSEADEPEGGALASDANGPAGGDAQPGPAGNGGGMDAGTLLRDASNTASDTDGAIGPIDAAHSTDSGMAANDSGSMRDAGTMPDTQNDCTPTSCAAPSTCVDGLGDFSCTCAAGYFQVNAKTCAPQFVSISANGYSSGGGTNCARRTNGTVACWGRNVFGQFGDGTSEQTTSLPIAINNLANAPEIAVGSDFICARRADGTVTCSGNNGAGQLGSGAAESSPTPVRVAGLSNVVEIAAGAEHACARRMNGTVACWGANGRGQLGNGMTSSAPTRTPVEVTNLTNAVEIAAGVYHSCARRSDGSVVCWGSNSSGQLGNGTEMDASTFVQVSVGADVNAPVLVNPVGLALGEWHSCARLASGGVACWGYGAHGELGDGRDSEAMVPVRVTNLSDATDIAANHFYSCARRADGSVSCWGQWPGAGASTPRAITGVSGAAEVAAGYWHTCARKTDGNIVCWGINDYGQFGNGMTSDGQTFILNAVAVRAY